MQGNKLLATLLATAVLGLAVLVGLEAAAERGGHSLDPTDAMNFNSYALRNDAPTARYVHLCSDAACTRLDDHFEWIAVRPGTSTEEQVYWGPDESAVYAVAGAPTTTGAHRCLVLDAAAKATAMVDEPLSAAGQCG